MVRRLTTYVLFLAAAFTFLLFVSFSEKEENTSHNTSHGDERMLPQEIRSVDVNKEYSFAGEAIPMSNFDAVERLDPAVGLGDVLEAQQLTAHGYIALWRRCR